nr:hypothetical protein [Halorhabdus salina]
MPHTTSVWVDHDADNRLLINTERGRRKESNVAPNPTVSVRDSGRAVRALLRGRLRQSGRLPRSGRRLSRASPRGDRRYVGRDA